MIKEFYQLVRFCLMKYCGVSHPVQNVIDRHWKQLMTEHALRSIHAQTGLWKTTISCLYIYIPSHDMAARLPKTLEGYEVEWAGCLSEDNDFIDLSDMKGWSRKKFLERTQIRAAWRAGIPLKFEYNKLVFEPERYSKKQMDRYNHYMTILDQGESHVDQVQR